MHETRWIRWCWFKDIWQSLSAPVLFYPMLQGLLGTLYAGWKTKYCSDHSRKTVPFVPVLRLCTTQIISDEISSKNGCAQTTCVQEHTLSSHHIDHFGSVPWQRAMKSITGSWCSGECRKFELWMRVLIAMDNEDVYILLHFPGMNS